MKFFLIIITFINLGRFGKFSSEVNPQSFKVMEHKFLYFSFI